MGTQTMRIEKSWFKLLENELRKPYVDSIKTFLKRESDQGHTVYPPPHLIFNAFLHTPFHAVKVVILGQDPYHGAGQAHGLSFSVPKGVKPPPSLRNIYKELERDLKIPAPNHGSLEGWAKQGVLLLNSSLTVREGAPSSHSRCGWKQLTDAVVTKLLEREQPLIFLLWGRAAAEKCRLLSHRPSPEPQSESESGHRLLTCGHPSPYSAHLFLGCGHFSQANQLLEQWGQTPIDWSHLP